MKLRARRNRIYMGVFLIAVVLSTCLSFTCVAAADNKKEQIYRYYTSVQINPGDTLWSIANEYCAYADMSISEYIDIIMELNNLTSDNITSGQYITVVYYSDEFK